MTTHSKSMLAAAFLALLASPALAQPAPEGAPRPAGEAVKIDLPPVTALPSGKRLPGKVIWFDLLTVDAARARPFYEAVLGWTFEDRGGYAIARDGGVPVAGVIQMPAPRAGAAAPPSRWMPLVSVADVGVAAAAVKTAGGRILEGPGSLGARGRYVAVADPRGAQFALVTAAGGDPVDADAPPPGWMWAELWTDDLKGSATFYKKVLGYEAWQVGAGKGATWIYAAGGRPRARAAPMPFTGVTSHWLPYVLVTDLKTALGRVTELAGHVLHKPLPDGPQYAVVTDPGGAAMVLEQRPEQPAAEVAKAPAAAPAPGTAEAGAAAAGAGVAAARPPSPPPPVETADPFGIDAAQEKARQDAAAQAAADSAVGTIGIPGADVGAEMVVAAPAPSVNVWIAPPAWGPFWGPFWGPGWGWGSGWGSPWGWAGTPGWGMPPAWGPSFPPPYRPGPGGFYPGYRPPPAPYRPGTGTRPPPPRGGGYATPRPAPAYRSTPAPTYRSSPAPTYRAAPAPAPSRPSAPAPRR